MKKMDHVKWLVEVVLGVAGFVAAAAIIAKPIRSAMRAVKEYTEKTEKWQTDTDKKLETLDRHQHDTWVETLRHKIFSNSLPLVERVNAGEMYINNGGNGVAKVQHEKNVQQLRERRDEL